MKRNIYKTRSITLSLLLALLLLGTTTQAQLITNGDMELWTGNCPTNTPPDSWTNYNNTLGPDQAGTCAGTVTAHSGSSYMNLVYITVSAIMEGASQTVAPFTLGHTYRVGFWGINSNGVYAATGDCKLQVHQNSLSIFETPNLAPGGAWTYYTVDFTTQSNSEVIAIRVVEGTNASAGSGSAGVDDFQVTELVNARDDMMHKPSAYPNPAHDALYIEQGDYATGDLGNVPYVISNQLGQQVLGATTQFSSGKARVDLSTLQPGIYAIDMMVGNDRLVQKIIVE